MATAPVREGVGSAVRLACGVGAVTVSATRCRGKVGLIGMTDLTVDVGSNTTGYRIRATTCKRVTAGTVGVGVRVGRNGAGTAVFVLKSAKAPLVAAGSINLTIDMESFVDDFAGGIDN